MSPAATSLLRSILSSSVLLGALPAWAAGGHHAVDDAAILERGACEVEAWASRSRDRERALHAGANCGMGPVELGAAADYVRPLGPSETAWGLEVKWATAVTDAFAVGAKLGVSTAAHRRPRHQGIAALALASWQLGEDLALHVNAGRDFAHRAADSSRYGAAVEWQAAPGWSLVGERYKEEDTQFVRAAVRWLPAARWSVDLSRAQRLSGPGASAWTLGASYAFEGW